MMIIFFSYKVRDVFFEEIIGTCQIYRIVLVDPRLINEYPSNLYEWLKCNKFSYGLKNGTCAENNMFHNLELPLVLSVDQAV